MQHCLGWINITAFLAGHCRPWLLEYIAVFLPAVLQLVYAWAVLKLLPGQQPAGT